MNIFVTNSCPEKSAKHLDNKRLVKMVLETAQLLSTSLSVYGALAPYKITHKNHPCAIWARESRGNYNWLVSHFDHLCKEYTHRFGRVHKCQDHLETFVSNSNFIPFGAQTAFVNCAQNNSLGISYKHVEDVFVAYRLYLNDRWNNDKFKPRWDRKNVEIDGAL